MLSANGCPHIHTLSSSTFNCLYKADRTETSISTTQGHRLYCCLGWNSVMNLVHILRFEIFSPYYKIPKSTILNLAWLGTYIYFFFQYCDLTIKWHLLGVLEILSNKISILTFPPPLILASLSLLITIDEWIIQHISIRTFNYQISQTFLYFLAAINIPKEEQWKNFWRLHFLLERQERRKQFHISEKVRFNLSSI